LFGARCVSEGGGGKGVWGVHFCWGGGAGCGRSVRFGGYGGGLRPSMCCRVPGVVVVVVWLCGCVGGVGVRWVCWVCWVWGVCVWVRVG